MLKHNQIIKVFNEKLIIFILKRCVSNFTKVYSFHTALKKFINSLNILSINQIINSKNDLELLFEAKIKHIL